jgi:hypothetical protein
VKVKGQSYRYEFTIEDDGIAVDLTGYTLVVGYQKPDGTQGTWSGVAIDNAGAGQGHLDVTGAQNDAAGVWTLWVEGTAGASTLVAVAKRLTVLEKGQPA